MSPKRLQGPLLDVKGLAREWDSNPVIRLRLRDEKPFLHPDSSKGEDIPTCTLNQEILVPLLERMAGLEHKPICPIEQTQDEISQLLTLNKRDPGESDVEKASWHIRKLVGFIKMKCRRREPSKARSDKTNRVEITYHGLCCCSWDSS